MSKLKYITITKDEFEKIYEDLEEQTGFAVMYRKWYYERMSEVLQLKEKIQELEEEIETRNLCIENAK